MGAKSKAFKKLLSKCAESGATPENERTATIIDCMAEHFKEDFIVNYTNGALNKTYDEINNALNNHKHVYCTFSYSYLPYIETDVGNLIFDNGYIRVVIKQDSTVTSEVKLKNPLINIKKSSDGTYYCTNTANEDITAMSMFFYMGEGYLLYAQYNYLIIPLAYYGTDTTAFAVSFNNIYIFENEYFSIKLTPKEANNMNSLFDVSITNKKATS